MPEDFAERLKEQLETWIEYYSHVGELEYDDYDMLMERCLSRIAERAVKDYIKEYC